MENNKYLKYIKMAFFIAAFTALAFIVVFLLSGCTYSRGLEDLAIVSGISVDREPGLSLHQKGEMDEMENAETSSMGTLNITAQIVSFSSDETGGGSANGPSGSWNLDLRGDSVFDTIRSALGKSPHKLYLSHNQVLLFGKETAESGLKNYVDFFVRDYEARLNVPIAVTEGKASEVLKLESENYKLSSEYLNQLIELQQNHGDSVETRLFDFVQDLVAWEKSTLVPYVKLVGEEEQKEIEVSGVAVFKRGTMVGLLTPDETRGVSWVKGMVSEGHVTVTTEQGVATIEITDASENHSLSFDEEGKLHVKIEIEQTGIIGDATGGAGSCYEKNIEELQKAVETKIKSEIQAGKKKLMELRCDAYGFGDALRRTQVSNWKKFNSDWDKVISEMVFEVEVKSTIKNTGALGENV